MKVIYWSEKKPYVGVVCSNECNSLTNGRPTFLYRPVLDWVGKTTRSTVPWVYICSLLLLNTVILIKPLTPSFVAFELVVPILWPRMARNFYPPFSSHLIVKARFFPSPKDTRLFQVRKTNETLYWSNTLLFYRTMNPKEARGIQSEFTRARDLSGPARRYWHTVY